MNIGPITNQPLPPKGMTQYSESTKSLMKALEEMQVGQTREMSADYHHEVYYRCARRLGIKVSFRKTVKGTVIIGRIA